MSSRIIIPDDPEKARLQAQHRLEEQLKRDRVAERKKRNSRLIREGAILEKVLPAVAEMSSDELRIFLEQTYGGSGESQVP